MFSLLSTHGKVIRRVIALIESYEDEPKAIYSSKAKLHLTGQLSTPNAKILAQCFLQLPISVDKRNGETLQFVISKRHIQGLKAWLFSLPEAQSHFTELGHRIHVLRSSTPFQRI